MPGVAEALKAMDRIKGWFSPEEGTEIYRIALLALEVAPAIIEIGSFHGRSTVVLGNACRDMGFGKVYAIDPHIPGGLKKDGEPNSLETFKRNISEAGLDGIVEPVVAMTEDAALPSGVKAGLVFIDGDHSYKAVSFDYKRAKEWLAPGGYISFHDFWENDPGVFQHCRDVIRYGNVEKISKAHRLLTVRPNGR